MKDDNPLPERATGRIERPYQCERCGHCFRVQIPTVTPRCPECNSKFVRLNYDTP